MGRHVAKTVGGGRASRVFMRDKKKKRIFYFFFYFFKEMRNLGCVW